MRTITPAIGTRPYFNRPGIEATMASSSAVTQVIFLQHLENTEANKAALK